MKRKAEERLRALVDPALGALEVWVKQRKAPGVSLAAANSILDRNGHGGDSKPQGANGGTTVNILALISPEALKDVIANAFSARRG